MTNLTQKNSSYSCENCMFTTSNKNDYSRHLLTAKHKSVTSGDIFGSTAYECGNCFKVYKSRNGLWCHKKKCKMSKTCNEKTPYDNPYENMSKDEIIMHLLKQNTDLSNKVLEIASTPTMNHSTINNNSNNKHFNLNVFLNENCKNAMNMKDFVNSLEIENYELENVGKLGYVEGISNIFIRSLKELDETERPMHCMDKKRETLYIKDDNVWNKDDKKEKVKQVIGQIAHKNFLKISDWKANNPLWQDTETKKNSQYLDIVRQVFTCITPDDDNGIKKIIKKVANEVCVDKDIVAV